MGQEDVFDGGAERTVIRPSPGGRRGPVPDAGPGSVPDPGAAAPEPFFEALRRPGSEQPVPTDGLNALISAASPLLALAARLRITASCGSIDTLHERIVNEIRAFERRVANASLPREALRGGHYALCATIDDVITNTPWGSAGQWARHSMTGTFHNDAVGGDRFFDFLTYFQKEPGRYGDVLELMYLCLSLGFQGRLRVVERGASEWARIREGLFNLLRQRHGDVERELSPHWRGLAAPHRPLAGFLPVWVIGVGTLALLTIAYIAYVYAVNSASDGLYGRFAALPPTGNATLQIASPALPPVDEGALARLRGFLAPEIRAGLVSVAQAGQTITVRPVSAIGSSASSGGLPWRSTPSRVLSASPAIPMINRSARCAFRPTTSFRSPAPRRCAT
jgi:type VI secretion system protein ImpK